jgi:S-adenosylmethionine:tRNA ribosyltransferase-isomerase
LEKDFVLKTSDFDYDLPPEFIAQTPIEPRDSSRLLVLDRLTGAMEHRHFHDILDYLVPGDLLVANESRVLAARLFAQKIPTGGRVELLLLKRVDEVTWEALVRGRRAGPGANLAFHGTPLTAQIVATTESGGRLIRFSEPVEGWLDRVGTVPLPPYIHTAIENGERYQTIYSRVMGSVAAPTAGLHFTPELLLQVRERGIELVFVTLDIGLDTFQPVKEENIEDHRMHMERCSLSPETANHINQARLAGRRVIAVGTTAVRTLETAARPDNPDDSCPCQTVRAFEGPTSLFIYPGYPFRAVDAMITNFHLPKSTLLMLVSAFAGREHIAVAYEEAKRLSYRFFSFGDAMFIH